MDRQTSGMMFSYYNKSAYHQTCVPKERQEIAAAAAAPTSHKEADYVKCDVVTKDEIWKQTVAKEQAGNKSWESNWSYLTEYDAMGNPVQKEELPETVSRFSDKMSNTNSGNYGARVNTEAGKLMQNLEFKFNSHNRRRKLDNEMVCY